MIRRSALFLLLGAASGCVPRAVETVVAADNARVPVPVPGVPAGTPAASAVLNGTVTVGTPMGLPPGSVVTVRIEDVSRADAPAAVVAEHAIRAAASFPVVFALAYTPQTIDVRHRYSVRATVRDAAGALLWTTTTATPVFTQGAPIDGVEVAVERAASGG